MLLIYTLKILSEDSTAGPCYPWIIRTRKRPLKVNPLKRGPKFHNIMLEKLWDFILQRIHKNCENTFSLYLTKFR